VINHQLTNALIMMVVLPRGPTIFIADLHRGDGKRFVVRADERLTAFAKLQAAIRRVSGEALSEN